MYYTQMGTMRWPLPAEQYATGAWHSPGCIHRAKIFKTFANSLIILAFVLTGAGKYVPANPIIINGRKWIFLQLFKAFITAMVNKAESIDVLVASFEKEGNVVHPFPASAMRQYPFLLRIEWKAFSELSSRIF